MGCVDVNETVHMVQLQCICVCNVAHEWVPIPIPCNCDVRFQYVSVKITFAPCEQTALNHKKKLSKTPSQKK